MEKRINNSQIRSFINNNKSEFPKSLHRLNISKKGETILLGFISDGIDNTSYFMVNQNLFNKIQSIVRDLKLEDGNYYYATRYLNCNKFFIHFITFLNLRHEKNLTYRDLAFDCNISTGTIRQLEKNEPFDPSISTILKYSLFFKKPIYEFFYLPYKKEILNIILNTFIINGYIEEDKAKEIFKKEINL